MSMLDFGNQVFDLFKNLGDVGMFMALAILVWLDGTAFPTLPEVWLVAIWRGHPDPSFGFGTVVVLVATLASVAGTMTLYALVKIGKLPKWMQNGMKKYTNWLIVSDERLLILNRFAPLIPYTGAFMAVNNWNFRRSTSYLFGSAVLKFSVWVMVFEFLQQTVAEDLWHWIALGLVTVVISTSIVVSLIYRRRNRRGGAPHDISGGTHL